MEKITEKYYLGSNKNTFILYEKKTSESGKEIYKNIGYIANLDALYNKLIELEIKNDVSMLSNIEKIIDLIRELREFTINFIKENK